MLRMMIRVASICSVIGVAFINACGSDSSSGISDLASLPKATAEVSSSSISKDKRNIQLFAASTGVLMSNFDNVTWSGGSHSRSFCEVGRIARNAYMQAAEPDKILCYIGVMKSNGAFASDVDDGNYHYYNVAGAGDGGSGIKVKFKIVKSGGNIQLFEMFMCQGGDTQTGYVVEDLSNLSAASITSVNTGTFSGGTYASRVGVSGAATTAGAWTSKAIEYSSYNTQTSGGAGTFSQKATVTQLADRLTVSAFMSGSYGSSTFENRMYGVMQILGDSSLDTFALGDGSAKYSLSHTEGGTQTYSNTSSWLGDTRAPLSPASSGEQYATANAATLRSIESVSISYASTETWDCTAPSSFTTATFSGAAMESGVQACNTRYGGEGGGYVDCHNATGE